MHYEGKRFPFDNLALFVKALLVLFLIPDSIVEYLFDDLMSLFNSDCRMRSLVVDPL